MPDQGVGFVLQEGGGPSPASLVDDWASFVDECRQGYDWPIEEYDNELRVRDRIAALEQAGELGAYLEAKLAEIDEAFRSLLLPPPAVRDQFDTWWKRGILASAGPEYAEDIQNQYGVTVQSIG